MKRLRVSADVSPDELINRYDRAGNRFLRLMVYLVLFRREAKDWVDRTRLGYEKTGSAIVIGFEPQWHHIFPRSVLRGANVPDDDIHALANITVLNERTNVKKLGSKEPARYILQFDILPELLRSHLIPESFIPDLSDETHLKGQWTLERYSDFLIERAELLAHEANAFLEGLEK